MFIYTGRSMLFISNSPILSQAANRRSRGFKVMSSEPSLSRFLQERDRRRLLLYQKFARDLKTKEVFDKLRVILNTNNARYVVECVEACRSMKKPRRSIKK